MSKFYKVPRSAWRTLIYSIKVFDKPNNDNLDRQFTRLRIQLLPGLLKKYLHKEFITSDQYESLISQLNSPDREAWYLAFILIKRLKPSNKK